MKKISQIEIAKKLGVSQSLVSIVLNGRKAGIAKETYDKIWEYALQHGYSPKGMKLPQGESGTGQNSRTVGYFLRAPLRLANKSNFFSHVTQGLHDALSEHEINMVFLGSESDYTNGETQRLAWQSRVLDGVVIMGEVESGFLSKVRQLGKPIAYISARSPGLCHSVNANEYEAGELLVDHLYELGHRRFAYFCGKIPRSRNEERLLATRMALEKRGLSLPSKSIYRMDEAERREGQQLAEQVLAQPVEDIPTAWICVNGLMARGAINHLFQAGLRVGKDISVVAFDNTRVCTDEFPTLTSASTLPEELGREAGRILVDAIDNKSKPYLDKVLPAEFNPRETSGKMELNPASLNSSTLPFKD